MEIKRRNGFAVWEADPKDARDTLQALTTTTPQEVAMAKQILTNKTDRQSKPPPKLTLEIPLQGLPARSGIIDRELYNNIHRRIKEQGKREGLVFSLRTDEALWAASEGDEMGLLVFNRKSKICKFFFPLEGFDLDALAEAAHQNIFMFLKGHVPYEFHDEMSDEIDAQADLWPDDKKKDVMSRALGELRIARKFSEVLEGLYAEAAEGDAA